MWGKTNKTLVHSPYDNEILFSYLESLPWKLVGDSNREWTVHLRDLAIQAQTDLSAVKVIESENFKYARRGPIVFRFDRHPGSHKKQKAKFVVATISGPNMATKGITFEEMLKQSNLSDEQITKTIEGRNA